MNSFLGLFLINQLEMTFLKENLRVILQIVYVETKFINYSFANG